MKKSSDLWHLLNGFKRGSVEDLFNWMIDNDTSAEFEVFVILCWSIWNVRCSCVPRTDLALK